MEKKTGKKSNKKKLTKKEKADIEKKKATALAKQKKGRPPVQKKQQFNSIDTLLDNALKSKAGIEYFERLLKIKHDEEERASKKLFHINFCKMQAEIPIIPKTKTVNTKAGVKMYSYAPLEKMIQGAGPIMGKWNFSYRWTEEFPKEKIKKITLHVTGYGHTETCSIEIPIMAANDYVNSIQQAGSSTTYGKRYTFMNTLGIVADEDDDGQGAKVPSSPPPSDSTPASDIKNVTPEASTTEKKKQEKAKTMLPKEITPDTLCDFGALKDAPVKYGKIKLDKLFALRRLAGNPEAIEPVMQHVLEGHIKHYQEILKYSLDDMKAASKTITGKEEWRECNCDERYKLMQNLRNIERKLRKPNDKT